MRSLALALLFAACGSSYPDTMSDGGGIDAIEVAGDAYVGDSSVIDPDATACGAIGDPCCPGSMCDNQFMICRGGECIDCGSQNQPCCTADPGYVCEPTRECSSSNHAVGTCA